MQGKKKRADEMIKIRRNEKKGKRELRRGK